MKLLLTLALLLLTACTGVPTYNAKAYKDSPVIFENDKGLAVIEHDMLIPYAYEGTDPDQWYVDNFKTQVIDEHEAKALNTLGIALAADIVTSNIGLNRGCVEANQLFRAAGPWGMTAYSAGNLGLYALGAKSSTIYQATLKKDTRKIYAGAAFKGYFALKNLKTIRGC